MKRLGAVLSLALVLLMGLALLPGVAGSQTLTLEDRVADLESQVAYLSSFHPTSTTSTTVPPQALVFDADSMLSEPLVLRPGDTVELRNGAQVMFGPGSFLDAQGTPTATWSDLGDTQNLVRDINVFGSGSIMFMAGSLPSTIRFVNFDLQPLFIPDHYPLHWHFAGEGSRGTVVEGVVVQNSTNRCVVPHASHGITFTDLICKNIDRTAIWWNGFPGLDQDSNDIAFERVLVDKVNVPPDGTDKFRTFAAQLMGGSGNSMINSVVMNVGGAGSQSGGFFWSLDNHPFNRPTEWVFQGNTARDMKARCVYFWVNDNKAHQIENVTCLGSGSVIESGAYQTKAAYVNPTVDVFLLKAVKGSLQGGSVGTLKVIKQVLSGPYTITGTQIGSFIVNNGAGIESVQITATDIGLSCEDVIVQSVAAGTTLTIDGVICDLGV